MVKSNRILHWLVINKCNAYCSTVTTDVVFKQNLSHSPWRTEKNFLRFVAGKRCFDADFLSPAVQVCPFRISVLG